MSTLKELRSNSNYLNINISGNRKLKNTETTSFIIWNLPAVITCPYRTAHCERLCYARKAERIYPEVSPARQKNFIDSRRDDFADRMIFTLEAEISRNEAKGKKSVIRIHESGDFYNKAYAMAWLKVAKHFEDRNAVFMAYTKSIRYFDGETIPANMVVRFSLWEDTKEEEKAIAERLELPTYSADTAEKVDEMVSRGLATKCDCADCANCGKCWDVKTKRIYCVIH